MLCGELRRVTCKSHVIPALCVDLQKQESVNLLHLLEFIFKRFLFHIRVPHGQPHNNFQGPGQGGLNSKIRPCVQDSFLAYLLMVSQTSKALNQTRAHKVGAKPIRPRLRPEVDGVPPGLLDVRAAHGGSTLTFNRCLLRRTYFAL
jgi:hypothetical protein